MSFEVELQVVGHVREFFPGGGEPGWVRLSAPATIRAIIASLGVSPDLVMAAFVDGQPADKDTVPAAGAKVLLLSPPAGG